MALSPCLLLPVNQIQWRRHDASERKTRIEARAFFSRQKVCRDAYFFRVCLSEDVVPCSFFLILCTEFGTPLRTRWCGMSPPHCVTIVSLCGVRWTPSPLTACSCWLQQVGGPTRGIPRWTHRASRMIRFSSHLVDAQKITS